MNKKTGIKNPVTTILFILVLGGSAVAQVKLLGEDTVANKNFPGENIAELENDIEHIEDFYFEVSPGFQGSFGVRGYAELTAYDSSFFLKTKHIIPGFKPAYNIEFVAGIKKIMSGCRVLLYILNRILG